MEVFLFETLECLWIHFQNPRLVQRDVEEAVRLLYKSLEFAMNNDGLEHITLDVPQYLFVSTQVANHFPELFECSVINSFQTVLGGKIVKQLRDESITQHTRSSTETWWMTAKRFVTSLSIVSIMLLVAVLPLQIQRYECTDSFIYRRLICIIL